MVFSPYFPTKEEYDEAVKTLKEFQNNAEYDLINTMDYMCVVAAEENIEKRRALLVALANSIFSEGDRKLVFFPQEMAKTLFNNVSGFVNKDCNVFLIAVAIDDNVYCYYFIDINGNIVEKRDTETNCVQKIYYIFRTQYGNYKEKEE